MSAQVYSVTGQTEGRMKIFLEWKSIDLSSKHVEVMLTIIKEFIIFLLLVAIGNNLPIFKTNQ